VGPFAFQRVQISRQRRDQGLALPRAHFCNFAAVENDPPHHLDIIVALAQYAGQIKWRLR
jgi:hypothetical protein